MSKLFQTGIACISASAVLLGGAVTANAAPALSSHPSATDSSTPPSSDLSPALKEKADRFVSLENTHFTLASEASGVLSEAEIEKVEEQIDVANSEIAKAIQDPTVEMQIQPESVRFVTAGSDVESTDGDDIDPYYQEGRNGIDYHWWGATFYVSKTTVNLIGAGVAIGGVWVPEPIVSKILSSLGIVAGLAPGGIQFNISYTQLAFLPVNPLAVTPWGIRFQ